MKLNASVIPGAAKKRALDPSAKSFRMTVFLLVLFFLTPASFAAEAVTEVLEKTQTQVLVRNHPRTGKPFVSIAPSGKDSQMDLFARFPKGTRPDYRMLDPKVKSGDIPYDGPVSDRKKVYILAASLATVGTVGGVGIITAAPAATGAGAAGGAGAYGLAGGAVAAGTVSTALLQTKSGPEDQNFTHVSESHAVNSETQSTGPSGENSNHQL